MALVAYTASVAGATVLTALLPLQKPNQLAFRKLASTFQEALALSYLE